MTCLRATPRRRAIDAMLHNAHLSPVQLNPETSAKLGSDRDLRYTVADLRTDLKTLKRQTISSRSPDVGGPRSSTRVSVDFRRDRHGYRPGAYPSSAHAMIAPDS